MTLHYATRSTFGTRHRFDLNGGAPLPSWESHHQLCDRLSQREINKNIMSPTSVRVAITDLDESVQQKQPPSSSKSFHDLRTRKSASLRPDQVIGGGNADNNLEQEIQRRHTGLGSFIGGVQLNFLEVQENSNKLKRWRHRPTRNSSTESKELTSDVEFVSQNNSFDCTVNSGFIRDWLDEGLEQVDKVNRIRLRSFHRATSKTNPVSPFLNVGLKSGQHWLSDSSLEEYKLREKYENLKDIFTRLESDYRNLRSSISRANQIIESRSKIRQDNLDELKNLIIKQNQHLEHLTNSNVQTKLDTSKPGNETIEFQIKTEKLEYERLQNEMHSLQVELEKYVSGENLLIRNADLGQKIEKENEFIESLERHLNSVTSDCGRLQKILTLQRTNYQIKETSDETKLELVNLKDKHSLLNEQLDQLYREGLVTNDEKSLNLVRARSEHVSMQMEVSKLQQMISAENQIKVELQKEMTNLQDENLQLEQDLRHKQTERRSLPLMEATSDISKLETEVQSWKSKCLQIELDKESLEVQLKELNNTRAELERNRRDDLDSLKQTQQQELEILQTKFSQLEASNMILESKHQSLAKELVESEIYKTELTQRLSMAEQMLDTLQKQQNEENKMRQQISEETIILLGTRLDKLNEHLEQLTQSFETKSNELDEIKRDYAKLKEKFEQAQRDHQTSIHIKEEEISKLRCTLNLERYNRLIMSHDIERELKTSLSELESMKSRLTTRLVGSPASTTTTETNIELDHDNS